MIVYDKVTHESKGSAFVWYATRVEAERAAAQLNLRHVFNDPTGLQVRTLEPYDRVPYVRCAARAVGVTVLRWGAEGAIHGEGALGAPRCRTEHAVPVLHMRASAHPRAVR